jgi:hypothetical protein
MSMRSVDSWNKKPQMTTVSTCVAGMIVLEDIESEWCGEEDNKAE